MAAQAKPEQEQRPGALMTREQIKAEMRTVPGGVMPERVKQHLAEVKALNTMVAEIAGMNWGKGLAPSMQRAVAEYCRVRGLDCTEIDILGGNIYRNHRYYLRRLSEMVEAGVIEYARPDMVHADPRLDEMIKAGGKDGEWAAAEKSRRLRERIERGIPEEAMAACVFRVKLKDVPAEFADAKWIVKGRMKKTREGPKLADPVGEEFPEVSVLSRAARRTMRFIASQIPGLKTIEEELDDAGVALADAVKETHKLELAKEAEVRVLGNPDMGDRRARSVDPVEYAGGGPAVEMVDPAALKDGDDPFAEGYQDDSDLVDELPLGETRRGSTRIAD